MVMQHPIGMILQRLGSSLALAAALGACDTSESDDPDVCTDDCDADDPVQTCDDPQYGDGSCQTEIACEVPDIDCFVTFEDDAAAAAWFAEWEALVAMEEGRAPRASIPAEDPRFRLTRDLLDRGWDAFSEHRPVGLLAERRPALVVIEDPVVQAFVIPDKDTQLSALVVMVHTGLLELGAGEDAMLGLMMHELQHAVGLHLIGDTAERTRKFYVAVDGEPLGKDTPEDPVARAAGVAWRELAGEVGYQSSEDLGGFPLDGDLRLLFDTVVSQGNSNTPEACAGSLAAVNEVVATIEARADALDGVIATDPDLYRQIEAAVTALRDECLAGVDVTFYEVIAALAMSTPEEVRDATSPEDRALVEGVHVLDAFWSLTVDRRERMRDIEAKFTADTGVGWDRLRYFSVEEDADDVSVPVLEASDLSPTGLADFIYDAKTRCRAAIDAGTAPYGADLGDDHHGQCWRVQHIDQVAAELEDTPRQARLRPTPPPGRYVAPRRLGLPKRLADQLAY